ncbi:MAG: glycerol acyltransferase [Flavobacteriaceae bacterium]|nr:1-acyl-sn-glycerol-3-phosphate acyltransferase [Bacteroidia bacterium]NNL15166.1 glycerol acyltransferase [Flavobacteriaceae bacterium]
MFFYFKKIEVHHVENVPKDKSVLILSNHQNALLDALLIATKCGRFVHYLTRASVFKKSFVDTLLRSLQMLPVYRVRDGWNNLSKNNPIFETCSELLSKNEGVVIFPEGSHNLNRTVRPLSKGFTRIIFETLKKYPETDLQLVPVGLNFIKAKEWEDSVSIYFGEPIKAKNYITDYTNADVLALKQVVHSNISELTTHIPSDDYDTILNRLEELNVNFLDPVRTNKCIASNFEECIVNKRNSFSVFKSVLKFLLKILLIGPYLIWSYYAKPKIVEIEFMSTFRFAVALTLVPIWLIFFGVLFLFLFGWMAGVGFVVFVLLVELLLIKF